MARLVFRSEARQALTKRHPGRAFGNLLRSVCMPYGQRGGHDAGGKAFTRCETFSKACFSRNVTAAVQPVWSKWIGGIKGLSKKSGVTAAPRKCTRKTVTPRYGNVPVDVELDVVKGGVALPESWARGPLALFFASLKQDPDLANKIVFFDVPMTSLNEHRILRTREEIMALRTYSTTIPTPPCRRLRSTTPN